MLNETIMYNVALVPAEYRADRAAAWGFRCTGAHTHTHTDDTTKMKQQPATVVQNNITPLLDF